ncbi:hypothetical protein MMC07_003080 [Pseudocyphellaria aurata]|nr:hypothetical protein [Pseudocyphellaria aurata]
MDPLQSLCLLPSNAPALHHDTESRAPENLGLSSLESTSKVTRSTSGALQRSTLQPVNNRSHTIGSVLQIREGRRRKHNGPYSRDPLFTKAELQSERYLAYRKKNKQGGKKPQEEQIWTDELEEVFQLALREIPNTGRRKKPCDVRKCGTNETKLCGRNEHIAHFIKRFTGEDRSRKQVSSHIQVLKAFQQGNDEWMALVTQARTNQLDPEFFGRGFEPHALSVHHSFLNKVPSPAIVGSNVPYQEHLIRRIKFEMYILDREERRRLHVYSSLQSEIGSSSRAIGETKDWRMKYPRLAPYYDRGELDIEVILFETYFSLMEHHPPVKSKLSIDFAIDIARGREFTDWKCHAYFYENDILEESVSTPTIIEHIPGTNDARIVVGLHSSWWVDHFVALTQQRLQREHGGNRLAVKAEDERPICQIRDISVVQEIWATPQAGAQSKRMAIFLWNFRQTRNHEAATTTWRRLIPPHPLTEPYFTRSLALEQVQPSPAVEKTPQHQDLLQPAPLHTEYFNFQPSFFAEHMEHLEDQIADPDARLKSTSSTSHGNSSTSTSTLPLEVSQDSAYSSQDDNFHSQDASCISRDLTYDSQDAIFPFREYEYPSENSPIHSQDSAYHLLDSGVESQHQDCPSQDYYHSQGTGYDSQHIEHMEYQFPSNQPHQRIPNHVDDNPECTAQDFASMHIQLSFCESEDSVPAHDAPCLAPMVNMLGPPAHSDTHDHRQKSSLYHFARSQIQDPFELDQWQAMDQAVQWANAKLQDGNLDEVGNIVGQGQVLGEIEEIEPGMDVEMGLIAAYGHGINDNLPI